MGVVCVEGVTKASGMVVRPPSFGLGWDQAQQTTLEQVQLDVTIRTASKSSFWFSLAATSTLGMPSFRGTISQRAPRDLTLQALHHTPRALVLCRPARYAAEHRGETDTGQASHRKEVVTNGTGDLITAAYHSN